MTGYRGQAQAVAASGGVAPLRSAVSPFILCSALTVGRGTLGLQEDRVLRPPAARAAPQGPQRSVPCGRAALGVGILHGGVAFLCLFLPRTRECAVSPEAQAASQPGVKGLVALPR